MRLRRVTAIAIATFLLPAAAAQGLTVQANNGKRCVLNTITEPTRFGLTVAPCVASRATSVSYLFEHKNEVVATTKPTNEKVPYSNVGTSSRPPDAQGRVRIDFTVILPPDRPRLHWRRSAGGDVCHRRPARKRKQLSCQVIVPVG
jgi:hypothetical protein